MEQEDNRRVERRVSPWRDVVGALLEQIAEDDRRAERAEAPELSERAKGALPGRR